MFLHPADAFLRPTDLVPAQVLSVLALHDSVAVPSVPSEIHLERVTGGYHVSVRLDENESRVLERVFSSRDEAAIAAMRLILDWWNLTE